MSQVRGDGYAGQMLRHVGLRVGDVERATAFYTGVFGLQTMRVDPGWAWAILSDGVVNLTINPIEVAGYEQEVVVPGGERAHLGFLIRSVPALRQLLRRCEELGGSVLLVEKSLQEPLADDARPRGLIKIADSDGNLIDLAVSPGHWAGIQPD